MEVNEGEPTQSGSGIRPYWTDHANSLKLGSPASIGSHWLRREIALYGAWLSDGKYEHEGHAESPATVIRAQIDPHARVSLG